MAKAVAAARVAQDTETVQERTQFASPEGARAGDLLFMLGQVGRQAAAAQHGAGVGAQFPQVKLLGLAVLVVEIAAGAAVALGQTDSLEATSPVTRAAIARLIDETLDHQHGMMPSRLPVVAETAQGQAEHAGGQIGITLAFGQDQEAAVVDDQAEAAGALARTPTDPLLAALEMEGGGTEAEQRDPLTVEFGDVAEGLAGQASVGQIMLLFQGAVEGLALVVPDEAKGYSFQDVRFVELRRHRHGHVVNRGAVKVPSFRTKVPPAFG